MPSSNHPSKGGPGSNQHQAKPPVAKPTPPPAAGQQSGAAGHADATPFDNAPSPAASNESMHAGLMAHAHEAGPAVKSLRKARWDSRARLVAALGALEGKQGLSPQEQSEQLWQAASAAQDAALELAAAARHAEIRDFDKHQADKMAAGGGAVPAISGDGGFVTPEQAHDDAAGWIASQEAGSADIDAELGQILDDNDGK